MRTVGAVCLSPRSMLILGRVIQISCKLLQYRDRSKVHSSCIIPMSLQPTHSISTLSCKLCCERGDHPP